MNPGVGERPDEMPLTEKGPGSVSPPPSSSSSPDTYRSSSAAPPDVGPSWASPETLALQGKGGDGDRKWTVIEVEAEPQAPRASSVLVQPHAHVPSLVPTSAAAAPAPPLAEAAPVPAVLSVAGTRRS